MTEVFRPTTLDQTVEAIQTATADSTPLRLQGLGTKTGLGRPMAEAVTLDMSALDSVVFYEPEELVLRVGPGARMSELTAMLTESNQMLAFEPPDFGALYGAGEAGTIGGAIAAGLSGPRRVFAGAARDFVLGVEGVSGRGEAFKSGGRVVKNVTGYDLSKLMTGSFGTLAALTQITLKVLPKPETECTISIAETDVTAAGALMRAALKSPYEVSAAAYVPQDPRRALSRVVLRLEGAAAALDHRRTGVIASLSRPDSELLDAEASAELWARVRDVAVYFEGEQKPLWKVVLPPTEMSEFLAATRYEAALVDWGGRAVWLTMGDSDLRPAPPSGAVYLIRAEAEDRTRFGAFPPRPRPLEALSNRIKASFDPLGILNPGRMYEES
ncbi:MAG: glycolate oxidase subunit GlcE [Pseudomonadota bacterium]